MKLRRGFCFLRFYLCIFGRAGSLLVLGLLSRCGVRVSSCSGFSCGAGLWGVRASVVSHVGSGSGAIFAAQALSCSAAGGVVLDQGSNPCPLHWQADSTTEPPGKPREEVFNFEGEAEFRF